jgi:hypothetical protein
MSNNSKDKKDNFVEVTNFFVDGDRKRAEMLARPETGCCPSSKCTPECKKEGKSYGTEHDNTDTVLFQRIWHKTLSELSNSFLAC